MANAYTVTIDDRGLKNLQKTAAKIGRLEVPHKRIAVYLDQWVHRNFDSDGGLLSTGKWAPFARGGRVKGGKIDTSAKLLRDTGQLYVHFNMMFSRTNAGVGNSIPYAKKHEEGEGRTPQRRMLPIKSEVLDQVKDIYEEYIDEVKDGK